MPVRESDISQEEKGATKPTGRVTAVKPAEGAIDKRLEDLALHGAVYLRLKNDATKLEKEVKKENEIIKAKAEECDDLMDVNGKHKEIYVPLGDGMNELFVQIQTRESVTVVDNIIQMVREKLGKKAENFIMTTEVLHESALEAMLNQGLISNADLLDWTSTKSTKSLIVKVNKKRT